MGISRNEQSTRFESMDISVSKPANSPGLPIIKSHLSSPLSLNINLHGIAQKLERGHVHNNARLSCRD